MTVPSAAVSEGQVPLLYSELKIALAVERVANEVPVRCSVRLRILGIPRAWAYQQP